jgi:hypothetical protein
MVGALGLALACGPSLRMIHESDSYFERCFSADVDPEIDVETRHACWAQWLEHYTPGQPPDRVSYARSRLRALEAGEVAPSLPDPDGAQPNPQATDSETLDPSGPDAPEVRAGYRAPPVMSVTTACDPICLNGWEACIPGCDDRTRDCRSACLARFRSCQAACY